GALRHRVFAHLDDLARDRPARGGRVIGRDRLLLELLKPIERHVPPSLGILGPRIPLHPAVRARREPAAPSTTARSTRPSPAAPWYIPHRRTVARSIGTRIRLSMAIATIPMTRMPARMMSVRR